MKTTHIRITKESKKLLKEMAKKENKTSAEELEDVIWSIHNDTKEKMHIKTVHSCGCVEIGEHSHLVIGKECECEKGLITNT